MKTIHLTLAAIAAITTLATSAHAGPGGNTAPATAPRQRTAPVVIVHTVRTAEPATCPKCARIIAAANATVRQTL